MKKFEKLSSEELQIVRETEYDDLGAIISVEENVFNYLSGEVYHCKKAMLKGKLVPIS